jgi:uncharacterized Zn finger protein
MGWRDWSDYDDFEHHFYPYDRHRDDPILGDHEPPPDAITISGPVQAISRRGDIGVEWWGRRWVETFEDIGDAGRLQRGKRYARNGSVEDIEIDRGRAFARVQGSRMVPYRTAITLQTFSDEEWDEAFDALAGQAIYSAKLLAGEMPADIEKMFRSLGLPLFPHDVNDLDFHCSCPDPAEPCKHAAALYYLLAEQLDADPFTLFHLRGRSREQVLARLHAHRGITAAAEPGVAPAEAGPRTAPLDADLEAFWLGSELNLVRTAPVTPKRSPMLRLLGKPPSDIEEDLQRLYVLVAKAAYWRLGGNGDGNSDNGSGDG